MLAALGRQLLEPAAASRGRRARCARRAPAAASPRRAARCRRRSARRASGQPRHPSTRRRRARRRPRSPRRSAPRRSFRRLGAGRVAVAARVHRERAEARREALGEQREHALAEAVGVMEQQRRARAAEVEERDLDARQGARCAGVARASSARASAAGKSSTSPPRGGRAGRGSVAPARYPPRGARPRSSTTRCAPAWRANLAALRARERSPLEERRHAAVALALVDDSEGRACFVLTRRAARLRRHAGQWALPGGAPRRGRGRPSRPRCASSRRRWASRSPPRRRARRPRRLPDALGLRDHAGRRSGAAPARVLTPDPQGGRLDPPRAPSTSSRGPASPCSARSPRATAR